MAKHVELTSIHLGAYWQAGDPGAVGSGKLWVDTSAGPPYALKSRNALDNAWDTVGTVTDHNHTAIGDGGILTNDAHDGYGDYAEIAAPANPAANTGRFYAKDDGAGNSRLYYRDSAGNEYMIGHLNGIRKGIIGITIGSYGSGVAITTGLKGFVPVPEDCEIVGWTVVADQVGNIVVDVWKDTYANYPPTVADTIAGAEKPTLAGVIKNQDLALGTWTTACVEGDWIGFNVDSVATVEWVCVALLVEYIT